MPHSSNKDQRAPTNTPDERRADQSCQSIVTAIGFIRDVLSKGDHDNFFPSTTPKKFNEESEEDSEEESKEESDETSHDSINVENIPVLPKFIKKRKPSTKEIVDEMMGIIKEVDQKGLLLFVDPYLTDFSLCQVYLSPMNKLAYNGALRTTIEEPAYLLINRISECYFSLKDISLLWYRYPMREANQEVPPSEFQQILNEAKSDNATHQSIEIAKPDGCFEYRRKPILITEHEMPHNLNEYMCEDFDFLFDEKADLNNSSAIDYQTIKEATEKSPDPGAYRVLYTMTKMYYHMLRYDLTQSYVTSGRCWLFLEIPRDDKRTLAYEYFESKNIRGTLERSRGNDYESLKETAFVKVVSLVLKEAIERFENDDKFKDPTQRIGSNALEDLEDLEESN